MQEGKETHASSFAKSGTTNTSSIESQLSRRSESLGEPVESECRTWRMAVTLDSRLPVMGAELCVDDYDEAAVAMAVTEALERPGSVSVGRKSAETVRSRRRFADRCRLVFAGSA